MRLRSLSILKQSLLKEMQHYLRAKYKAVYGKTERCAVFKEVRETSTSIFIPDYDVYLARYEPEDKSYIRDTPKQEPVQRSSPWSAFSPTPSCFNIASFHETFSRSRTLLSVEKLSGKRTGFKSKRKSLNKDTGQDGDENNWSEHNSYCNSFVRTDARGILRSATGPRDEPRYWIILEAAGFCERTIHLKCLP